MRIVIANGMLRRPSSAMEAKCNTQKYEYEFPHLGSVSSRDIARASLLQFTRHAAQHEVLMLSS